MGLRVIGAGLGRTGTMSLKLALTRLLGAPCYHMVEVFQNPSHLAVWTAAGRGDAVDWNALFKGFAATVDWPSAAFWPELMEAFPEAHVLLSTRESSSWWKSASETIFAARPSLDGGPMAQMLEAVLGARFTPSTHDRDAAIRAYEANTTKLRATVPAATRDGGRSAACSACPFRPSPSPVRTRPRSSRLGSREGTGRRDRKSRRQRGRGGPARATAENNQPGSASPPSPIPASPPR